MFARKFICNDVPSLVRLNRPIGAGLTIQARSISAGLNTSNQNNGTNSNSFNRSSATGLNVFKRTLETGKNKYHGPYIREPFEYTETVPKVVTPEEAVSVIKSNDSVFLHSAAATPTVLIKALAKHGIENKLNNVKLYHIHLEGPPILTDPKCYGIFRSNSFFTGANCRKAIADGAADFIPIFLGDIPQVFRRGRIALDYAIVQVSPPDSHGYCTLGPSVDITRSACQTAKKIIAVVNKCMPRTFGHGVIHFSHFDTVVYHDEPPYYLHARPDTEADTKIGKLISEHLVENGSTLQMGIGSIPDAVLKQLHNHRGLGIHSEMVSDGIVDLILKGAVCNSNKKVHPGKTLTSFALGTQCLYDFLDNNPAVLMSDITFANNIEVIGRNPKVVAINSCLEIDLTGQVVSDSIGERIFSGIGGQLDFITGARRAVDGLGKPILAMQSTTKSGQSKIVPTLKQGAGVCTTRSHVHYIVTEHGIASLFGKSLRQRAYEMLKIAHPDHRASLEKAAFERLKVMPSAD